MSDDLVSCGAAALVHLFATRQASPVEAAKAALERISQHNPRYNAFCLVDETAALASARQSEARWLKGEPLSHIDGVTATIKDIILTRGWPTLRGSRSTDPNQKWDEDAPAVERLREAGAVLLGKTTTPEFGWKAVCDSPLTGITRNPWNPERTPGGSSGGAAVAAPLGMGCLHLGTDGGGSIRIPSAFSGVFGIKPTFGRVPAYPLSPFGTVAHLGPITAGVDDAARMLTVISRPDARDWYALPYLARDYSVGIDAGVHGLRIALSTTLGYATRVNAEIVTLVERAAAKLGELGARIERRDPGFAQPSKIFEAHWLTGAANVRRAVPTEKRALLEPGFNHFADLGERISHMDYVEAMNERAALGAHMAQFHTEFDVLLTPSVAVEAFECGRVAPVGLDETTWFEWTPFSFPFNLTQQPAASIPCGFTSSGLPVGLQIIAAKYREDLVLRVARAYESVDPIARPPL
jgi:aspartyl-tRNA(Asn)/glutamyl-tRNA(Gln) amidotransferase subunit A